MSLKKDSIYHNKHINSIPLTQGRENNNQRNDISKTVVQSCNQSVYSEHSDFNCG